MDIERPKLKVTKHPKEVDKWFIEFLSPRQGGMAGIEKYDRLGYWASEGELKATVLMIMSALDREIMGKLFELFMTEA